MTFAVELSSEIIGKIDFQHSCFGLGDGILEKDAGCIGVNACPFGVEDVGQAEYDGTGTVFEEVLSDGQVHSAGGQHFTLCDKITCIIVAGHLEGIGVEQLHIGIQFGEPAEAGVGQALR